MQYGKESKNKDFVKHFQRELLINEIAKMVTQLRKKAKLTQQELAVATNVKLKIVIDKQH